MLCHGQNDGVVPLDIGVRSREFLKRLGYMIDWKEYPSQHRPSSDQIKDIASWIRRLLKLDEF